MFSLSQCRNRIKDLLSPSKVHPGIQEFSQIPISEDYQGLLLAKWCLSEGWPKRPGMVVPL